MTPTAGARGHAWRPSFSEDGALEVRARQQRALAGPGKGEADLVYDPPSVKWKQAQALYATSQQFAPGRNQALSFNVEAGIFTDARVRQAFVYASNRQQIVSSVFRGAVPFEGNGALSNTTQDYLNLDNAYPHNPDKAVALLKQAGYDRLNAEGYRVSKDGKVLRAVLRCTPPWSMPKA
jgi:peptide/nickel transport system substrate-binding protein